MLKCFYLLFLPSIFSFYKLWACTWHLPLASNFTLSAHKTILGLLFLFFLLWEFRSYKIKCGILQTLSRDPNTNKYYNFTGTAVPVSKIPVGLGFSRRKSMFQIDWCTVCRARAQHCVLRLCLSLPAEDTRHARDGPQRAAHQPSLAVCL